MRILQYRTVVHPTVQYPKWFRFVCLIGCWDMFCTVLWKFDYCTVQNPLSKQTYCTVHFDVRTETILYNTILYCREMYNTNTITTAKTDCNAVHYTTVLYCVFTQLCTRRSFSPGKSTPSGSLRVLRCKVVLYSYCTIQYRTDPHRNFHYCILWKHFLWDSKQSHYSLNTFSLGLSKAIILWRHFLWDSKQSHYSLETFSLGF